MLHLIVVRVEGTAWSQKCVGQNFTHSFIDSHNSKEHNRYYPIFTKFIHTAAVQSTDGDMRIHELVLQGLSLRRTVSTQVEGSLRLRYSTTQ